MKVLTALKIKLKSLFKVKPKEKYLTKEPKTLQEAIDILTEAHKAGQVIKNEQGRYMLKSNPVTEKKKKVLTIKSQGRS